MIYDVVIKNGTVVDPKTELQTVANIGVKDGKIAIVTREDFSEQKSLRQRTKSFARGL